MRDVSSTRSGARPRCESDAATLDYASIDHPTDPATRVARWRRNRARIATSRWSSCAPPRPPRSPAAGGWAAATRTRPTAPPSRPCASCSTASRWTASSSSARARRTKRRCSSTASRSATAPRPAMDIAVDPIDGTTLTSLGRRGAIAVIAISERGTMFDPGPCVYMEKIAAGPAAADVDRHQRAGEGQPRSGRQGARRAGQRRDRGHPRPRPPHRHHPRVPRGRRAHPPHPRRRRRRRDLGRVAQLRQRRAVRHRRHSRRRDRGVRAQVPRRLDPGPALAAQRRRAHAPRSTWATTSTGCS